MNVMYMEQSLFLIKYYTRINMKSILYYLIQIKQFIYAKGASSGYKLVTMLRGSLKYLSTMTVEYNSDFW